jgi:hypothetical protein
MSQNVTSGWLFGVSNKRGATTRIGNDWEERSCSVLPEPLCQLPDILGTQKLRGRSIGSATLNSEGQDLS